MYHMNANSMLVEHCVLYAHLSFPAVPSFVKEERGRRKRRGSIDINDMVMVSRSICATTCM